MLVTKGFYERGNCKSVNFFKLFHVLDLAKDADLEFIWSKVGNSHKAVLEKCSFTIRKKSYQPRHD